MNDLEQSDPFLQNMFSRMSPGAEYLFSPYQLDEIKKAFSARTFGAHAIDSRFSIRFFRSSYYVIFLAGRERRLRAAIRFGTPRLPFALAAVAMAGYLLFANW